MIEHLFMFVLYFGLWVGPVLLFCGVGMLWAFHKKNLRWYRILTPLPIIPLLILIIMATRFVIIQNDLKTLREEQRLNDKLNLIKNPEAFRVYTQKLIDNPDVCLPTPDGFHLYKPDKLRPDTRDAIFVSPNTMRGYANVFVTRENETDLSGRLGHISTVNLGEAKEVTILRSPEFPYYEEMKVGEKFDVRIQLLENNDGDRKGVEAKSFDRVFNGNDCATLVLEELPPSSFVVIGYEWNSQSSNSRFTSVTLPPWGSPHYKYMIYIWKDNNFMFYEDGLRNQQIAFPSGGVARFKLVGIDENLALCSGDTSAQWNPHISTEPQSTGGEVVPITKNVLLDGQSCFPKD